MVRPVTRRYNGSPLGRDAKVGPRSRRLQSDGNPALDVVAMQLRQANLEGTWEIALRRLVKEALRIA